MRFDADERDPLSPGRVRVNEDKARPSALRLLLVGAVLCGVQLINGGTTIVTKAAVQGHVDPLVFSFLRDVGGACVLLAACGATGQLVRLRQIDVCWFVMIGVFGVYIGQVFMALAMDYVSAINAALLQPTQPVLTALLASALGLDPIQLRTRSGGLLLAGLLLAVVGGAMPAALGATDGGKGGGSLGALLTGNALLAAQCIGGAVYQCTQKHALNQGYPPLAVAAYGYAFGAVAVGLALPTSKLELRYWALPASSAYQLAYVIFLTSALNYGAQSWANKQSSPTVVTAFFPLQVVFSSLLSAVFFGRPPTLAEYVGGAMTIGGLIAMLCAKYLQAAAASSAELGHLRVAFSAESQSESDDGLPHG